MDQLKPSDILYQAGLRCTPKRSIILQILLQAKGPLTHKEIESLLPHDININQVSLYRALEAFHRARIVHRIHNQDKAWSFALCSCMGVGHCHPHFFCNSCGKVECLNRMELPHLTDTPPGYVVEEREMYLKGLCVKCNTREG